MPGPEAHVNNRAITIMLYHGNSRCNFHFKNYKYYKTLHVLYKQHVKVVRK